MQQIESQVYQYASLLDENLNEQILFNVASVKNQTASLAEHPAITMDAQSSKLSAELAVEIGRLEKNIDDYLLLMQHVESRYPGMPVLLDFMEPVNRQFSDAVELAIQEGVMTDHNPVVIESEHYQVMQILQELRFAWSQQISWFRVFVANRMGAFGDPDVSMQRNLVNRSMFAGTVQKLLAKLKRMEQKNLLGLQQSDSLLIMLGSSKEYERFLAKATGIYMSENWRSDISILRDKLQPNLTVSRYYISLLEERFNIYAEHSLNQSQYTAELLSKFIWLFVGAITILLGSGYIVFVKSIRKPLQHLTSAMEAEANGVEFAPGQYSSAEEILQLQNAFDGMRAQVYSRQTRLKSILENAAEGIIIFDEEGSIESVNPAAEKLFGYEAGEVIGKNISVFMPPEQSDKYDELVNTCDSYNIIGKSREVLAQRKDGLIFPMSLKLSEFTLENKRYLTAMVDDFSDRHAAMESLRHMAEHDSLTGLYNRQYFLVELERMIEYSRRSEIYDYACLYIDLDNFKYINDTLGHLAGDRLLIEIAAIFSMRIRKSDLLARLGGDEFAIILANVDPVQAERTADYYRRKIANYLFKHKGKSVDVGCSIGLAMMGPDICDKEDIMMRADIACHMAKRGGRNRVHVYINDDQENINLYTRIWAGQSALRQRLIKTIMFAYQPILHTVDQVVYTYELLLRMHETASGEMFLPGTFLNAAERFGLMVDIDCWVITHAIQQLSDIQQHKPDTAFSINLSAKSLTENIILKSIEAALRHNRLTPGSLTFEITEDVAISDMNMAIAFIRQLNSLGCKTALDDFGVGYSSFSHLKDLPVDMVKIDGSFIRNIERDKLNYALVKSMNDICHTLGKQTVAEFVENETVLTLLKKIGIDYVQGYYTGKPELELNIRDDQKN